MRSIFIGAVLPLVFAYLAIGAQVPAPVNVPKLIPKDNGFQHDFNARSPGDVLVVSVSPEPGYEMRNGTVTGGAPIWVGQGNFNATGSMPGNAAGQHDGTFAGEYRKIPQGGGGGTGGDPWTKWTGGALAKVVKIEHVTILLAADQTTPNTRSTVGVCEDVRISTVPATNATWAISTVPPTTATGDTFVWTAPPTKGNVQFTATFANGTTATTSLDVIQPASVAYTRTGTNPIPVTPGIAGATMSLIIDLDPDTVTFAGVMFREGTGGVGTGTGYFNTPQWIARSIHPTGPWISVRQNNWVQTPDTSGIPYLPPPYVGGGILTQPIPNEYRGVTEPATTAHPISTTTWDGNLTANGTFTITKGSATYSRTP